ncbi:MAG: hypothetical protein H0W65_08990 [Sphingomonas sp.]|uniref:hypothetical protein n=1 Tax=Sphingomonas sp. TaxID=28214 RepID=UPI00178F5EE8|nr:hypothetical protein [Sphingomonas sp.]MBA3667843.1 hypothetical protein [Sphingomonas sp.]
MKAVRLIVAALALAACDATPQPASTPGPTAGLGQPAIVNGLRLRPLDVLEDSRCPASVQCVWAGRVVLQTGIGSPDGGEEMRLDLTLGQSVSVYGGTLTLVRVTPAKGTIGSLDRNAYRFTFTFTYSR